MLATLRPGLNAQLDYVVPAGRTVPNLLPESEDFAVLPTVLTTGYLVGIVEGTCTRPIRGHLDEGEQTLGVHVDLSHEAPAPSRRLRLWLRERAVTGSGRTGPA